MAKRDLNTASGTKLRLLEAAEELFAVQGFDAVSVRDITTKAGANVAAVNYHFGSRDELIAAVMVRYVQPMNDERLARLEALEGKFGGKGVPLEELADAFVRPFITQLRRSELSERLFFKLMAHTLAERGARMPAEVEDSFRRVLARFAKAFAKSLPGVPLEELLWRMHFMAGSMIHGLAHAETLLRLTNGASGDPGADTILVRLIRFAVAGMRGNEEARTEPAVEAKPRGPQSEFVF